MEGNNKKQLYTTLAVLLAIVLIVGGTIVFTKHKSTNAQTADSNTTLTTVTPNNDTSSSTTSQTYKDGSYSATGDYTSPGGAESLTVHVTLKNNIITNTSATTGANDGTADEFQSDFISGYKQLVVGKDINTVHLSRVSGSSLTSQGFNDAIKQIEAQAQA